MNPSDRTLRRIRRAYETTHVLAGLRGLAIAVAVGVLAIGLHRITPASWLVAALLGASLVALSWRGGAYRRGALAGVLAGLPPLVVPSLVMSAAMQGHCAGCGVAPTWPCLLACFGTSAVVGTIVGYRAVADRMPRAYGMSAVATAALTGLLACATVGIGGAVGVVVGLVGGSLTGWIAAGRAAHT